MKTNLKTIDKPKQLNKLEQSARRADFFRRLLVSGFILFIIALFAGGGLFFWLQQQGQKFTVPEYTNSDTGSPSYWTDRTKQDIEVSRIKDTDGFNQEKLRFLVMNTLREAQQITSNYAKVQPAADTAITLAESNVNLNIDEPLKFMTDSPVGQMMLARIYISQALMCLRINDNSQARVLFQQYDRLVIESDLKLNSEVNELAFCGAVSVLSLLGDTARLNGLFDRQLEFSLRLQTAQQMRAFRIIAGEQARSGMNVYAMNTVKKIKSTVELSRAYQQIIMFAVRPRKMMPVEPGVIFPQTAGPWEPPQSPAVAKQIISDVLQQVAALEELDMQIDVLMQLAGSRLMCDPAVYTLFREAVEDNSKFDELVKRPVLKLLNEPDSDMIRASLGMPPVQRETEKNIDPALDDWKSATGVISVDVSRIDPALMETITAVQTIRFYENTAQCYLMVNRQQEAAAVLRKAFALVKTLPDAADRLPAMLRIGEKQLTAKVPAEAAASFRAVGLPDSASNTGIYSLETLSNLARLQCIGRFRNDAEKTIACIPTASVRDDDYVLLIKEQLRISMLPEAEKLIAKIAGESRRTEMRHVLGIAKDGKEEHYKALDLPYPGSEPDANLLKLGFERLLSYGLFAAAALTAEKMNDARLRSSYLTRTVREYVQWYRVYYSDDRESRSVRKRIFGLAEQTAQRIEQPSAKAAAVEMLITAALPFRKNDKLQDKLAALTAQTITAVQKNDVPPEEKGEVMSRLILAKIALAAPDDVPESSTAPLLDKEKNPAVFDETMKLITETVDTVNKMGDVPNRSYTIAVVAKALGQIGRSNASLAMLKDAEESATGLKNFKDAVSILLSLIPAYRSLDENDDVQRVYYAACSIVLEAYGETDTSADAALMWRTRDSELERITSSQLEQGYVADAVIFASRINEPMLKDRLLRTAAYINLDRNGVQIAENIARRIKTPAVLTNTLRDVLFVKRHNSRQQNEAKAEENPAKEDEKGG
ncbi:MAG: hypothetical protein LBN39_12625, partial [Planctomycetaceae bacterium]|nr:hypothetical protein [Planctomycetaceae bacterium]